MPSEGRPAQLELNIPLSIRPALAISIDFQPSAAGKCAVQATLRRTGIGVPRELSQPGQNLGNIDFYKYADRAVLRMTVGRRDLSALQIPTPGVSLLEFQPGTPAQILAQCTRVSRNLEEYLNSALPLRIGIVVDASPSLFAEDPDMQVVWILQRSSEPQTQDQTIRFSLERPQYLPQWTREDYLATPAKP